MSGVNLKLILHLILWAENFVKKNHFLFIQSGAILAEDVWVRIDLTRTIWLGTYLTDPRSSPVSPQNSKPRRMKKSGIPDLVLRKESSQPNAKLLQLTQRNQHNTDKPTQTTNMNELTQPKKNPMNQRWLHALVWVCFVVLIASVWVS